MECAWYRGRIKRATVKGMLCIYRANNELLQETKLSSVYESVVKEIWGASIGDNWICCEAVGTLEGIWNEAVFSKKDKWVGTFSAFGLPKEAGSNNTWIMTSVYSPNDSRHHDPFWCELDSIHNRWSGPWCIGGGRNVVTFSSKRSRVQHAYFGYDYLFEFDQSACFSQSAAGWG